jgi:hypothetical protein
MNRSDNANTDFVSLLFNNRTNSVASARIAATGGVTTSALAFLIRPSTGVATTNEAMRISSDGFVGIGTTAPERLLHLHSTGTSAYMKVSTGNTGAASTDGFFIGYASDSNAYISNAENTPLRFDTNNINRMIITEVGNVGIGTTNPGYLLDVVGAGGIRVTGTNSNGFMETLVNTSGTTTSDGLQIWAGSNSSAGAVMVYFVRPDATAIGSIAQQSATTVAFNTTSDRRIKENIAESSAGLDLLERIKVRDYNYIADPDKQTLQGFIAQELYELYPQAVTVGGEDPKTHPWQVDYGKLTPLLVRSVQELSGQEQATQRSVEELAAENNRLKQELAQMKAALCSKFSELPLCTSLSPPQP